MIPANRDFLEWLDDEGELMPEAPEHIKKQYEQWKVHEAEWNRLSLEAMRGE